jgi:hypothetical protein
MGQGQRQESSRDSRQGQNERSHKSSSLSQDESVLGKAESRPKKVGFQIQADFCLVA